MPVPTSLEAKVPVAPLVFRVTVSPLNTPTSVAPDVLRVAVVVALYTLFAAVMPETVRPSRRDVRRRRRLRQRVIACLRPRRSSARPPSP